jgi:hypothetical protein
MPGSAKLDSRMTGNILSDNTGSPGCIGCSYLFQIPEFGSQPDTWLCYYFGNRRINITEGCEHKKN